MKLKILLTNDDSYSSNRIKLLYDLLSNYGEVFMVAPKYIESAKGMAIRSFVSVDFKKVDKHHYIVDGTPADCVQFGLAIIKGINLVVSGINYGFNASSDILYSGTCGACIQSCFAKIKSIAFSADYEANDEYIMKNVKEALDYILKTNILSKEYFINVNVPTITPNKGVLITKPAPFKYSYQLVKRENDFAIDRILDNEETDLIYDRAAYKAGYISVSPISYMPFLMKDFNKVVRKVGKHYGKRRN